MSLHVSMFSWLPLLLNKWYMNWLLPGKHFSSGKSTKLPSNMRCKSRIQIGWFVLDDDYFLSFHKKLLKSHTDHSIALVMKTSYFFFSLSSFGLKRGIVVMELWHVILQTFWAHHPPQQPQHPTTAFMSPYKETPKSNQTKSFPRRHIYLPAVIPIIFYSHEWPYAIISSLLLHIPSNQKYDKTW